MKYAKRVDLNHGEIRDFLRAVVGMKILDTSGMAGLGCDLIAFYQDMPPQFLEIKSGPKDPLTDKEKRLKALSANAGTWHRVDSIEGALRVFGISTERAPENW
jgi:hypothetical protein